MTTESVQCASTLQSIEDFADAVINVPGGHFLKGAPPDAVIGMAGGFGAPLFALTHLAPEVVSKPTGHVVVGGDVLALAMNGGRWLSLFSRLLQPKCKLEFTICATGRDDRRKSSKNLMAQPPQKVISNRWVDCIERLTADALILDPLTFDDVWQAVTSPYIEHFARDAALLFTSRSLPELAVIRALLRARNYDVTNPLPFCRREGEPRHQHDGAWWIRVRTEGLESPRPLEPADRESFEQAYKTYYAVLFETETREQKSRVAELYATYGQVSVEGATLPRAVLMTPGLGIDPTSGRLFEPGPEGSRWSSRIRADYLALMPETVDSNENLSGRFRLMSWIARTVAKGIADDEGEPMFSAERIDLLDAPEIATASAPTAHAADALPPVPRTPFRRRARLSRAAGVTNVLAVAARLGVPGADPNDVSLRARQHIVAWMAEKGFAIDVAKAEQIVESQNGEVAVESGEGIWTIRFDDRTQMSQGAFWRVELTLLVAQAALGLRVAQVRQYESAPPPQPGVPKVLQTLANQIGLHDGGVALRSGPWRLAGTEDAHTVLALISDKTRLHPVVVIPACGTPDFTVDRLAARLTGVAHIVVLDDLGIDELINRLGRPLSVYGKALRLYRPGFYEDADPFDHPLWHFQGNSIPHRVLNEVAEEACAIGIQAVNLEERVPSFQSMRRAIADLRVKRAQERTNDVSASIEEERSRQGELRHELELLLRMYQESNDDLAGENRRLAHENELLSMEREDALDEIRRLKYQLRSRKPREVGTNDELPEESTEYPLNWDELETWVESNFNGALVLLPTAIKSARDCPFDDVCFAAKAIEFLARNYVALRRRAPYDEAPRIQYEEARAALGVEVGPVGTATEDKRYKHEYQREFDGRKITLDLHVKRGVGFDPSKIFRLYFCFDEASQSVIVGHLPTHLTNRTTHSG